MKKVGSILENKLKGLNDYIALALVNSKKYQKTNIEILRHLTQKENIPGIYVTINKPYNVMVTILKTNKIDTDMIIFIDAITKLGSEKELKKTENCLFIESPKDLSDIGIAMSQAIDSIKSKEKFIFLDSLSTLLIYNHAGTVAKFMHFLTSKMRTWKVRGIIISLEKESDKDIIAELSQFCDITLNFK